MNRQKSLLACTMALGLLLGLGTTAQAKEWEQSLVVSLSGYKANGEYFQWGFSKDSLATEIDHGKQSYWYVSESCVCSFMLGACSYSLQDHSFFEYDQGFWNVVEGDSLKAGVALDLNDTTAFINIAANVVYRSGSSLTESYKFSEKRGSTVNDTNYFVYRKDSTYYALCQYITVYNRSIDVYHSSTDNRDESELGVPAYFAHQCIFQDDGTPTFSKIPMYAGELPAGKYVDPPSVVAKPMRKKVEPNVDRKPYLVNGRSAKRNSASGIRVEKERVYRQ